MKRVGGHQDPCLYSNPFMPVAFQGALALSGISSRSENIDRKADQNHPHIAPFLDFNVIFESVIILGYIFQGDLQA